MGQGLFIKVAQVVADVFSVPVGNIKSLIIKGIDKGIETKGK